MATQTKPQNRAPEQKPPQYKDTGKLDSSILLSETSSGSLVWEEERSQASSVTNDVEELTARVKEMLSGNANKRSNVTDAVDFGDTRLETNLVQLANKKLMNSHRIFGSLYRNRYTVISFTPNHRDKTKFKMLIPHGCSSIITENGKALGVFKPGRYYRSGFYQVAYCVNTQYIPYHFNVSSCPTRDNVRITIQVDFLFHVTDAIKFMFDIGPENLEELLRATQSEAVRSLARTVYVEQAYDLRGVDSDDMLATLNDKLNPFGVNVDQVTIANVNLPRDIAQALQNSTSFASKTKEQIRTNELKTLIQTNDQMLKLVRQQRHNDIDMMIKKSRKERSAVKQDIREIVAKGEAEITKIKAELDAHLSEIEAKSKLDVAKVEAQRDREVNEITTKARMDVKRIDAETDQYVSKVNAETELKISENRAKALGFKLEAEKIGAQVLAAQRQYEADMARIEVINALASNRALISGDAEGNIITQLLVAQRTADQIGANLKK